METNENTAQKVDQKNEHLQQTLNTINTILNQNGKEVNVDEIDDILNREFLKSTETIADKILNAISALPSEIQKDPEVQKIINAFKVQSVSGNNEGNSNRAKAEASSLTDDMDPLNTMISLNRKDKKEINKLISDCQKYTQGADIYKNLDRNLNAIKNILSKETTTLRELKQIDDFLKKNSIQTGPRSKDNIQPLLTGVRDFLNQVKTALEKNKEGDKVLKEHQEKKEQQEKEQQERIARQEQMQKEKEATDRYEKNLRFREESRAFSIFVHMIPNDMGNLSQFTENEITNIIGFISDSKNEAQIGSNQNPKTDVLNLYFTMNRYAQLLDTDKAPNGKKITKYDRERFNQIFDHIKTVYANNNGTNEIAEYELSSIITTDSIKDKAPKNRDGKDLTQDDDKFINDNYGGRSFTAEEFRTKFNSVNAERKEKNKQALKESIKIDNTLITNELLNKITLTEEGEGEAKTIKLTYKQDNTSEPVELTADNFITTLGLNIDTKNIDFLGNEKEEAIAELQNDRFKELMDYKKKQKPNPTEKPEEKLEDLDPDTIKNNLRCGLNANDIAKFYNEAKKKNDLNQEQKKLLLLTQKGLTHQDRTNDDVKELQTQLKFGGKSVDGRFGIDTYNALRRYFKEEPIKREAKDKEGTKPLIDQRISKNLKAIDIDPNDGRSIAKIETNLGIRGQNTTIYTRDGYAGYYYKQGKEIIHINCPPNIYIEKLSKFTDHKKKEVRTPAYPTDCPYFLSGIKQTFTESFNSCEIPLPKNYEIIYKNSYYTLKTFDNETSIELNTFVNGFIYKNNLQESLKLINLINFLKRTLPKGTKTNGNFSFDDNGYLLSNKTKIKGVYPFDNKYYKSLTEEQKQNFIDIFNMIDFG